MRVVVVMAAVALALAGCARERYATSYDDVVTARQQDAIDRGWIPEALPEEAVDLREVHAPLEDLAVARATLPSGLIPDGCTETTADIGEPGLDAEWVPEGVASEGTPVQCGVWAGTISGTQIVLWTDRASDADTD